MSVRSKKPTVSGDHGFEGVGLGRERVREDEDVDTERGILGEVTTRSRSPHAAQIVSTARRAAGPRSQAM
jgi:hypothetical protein